MVVLKDVNKVWDNGYHALKNINLTINSGEFVAIIGSSGAGKTTLIKTINKIIPISSGVINIKIWEKDQKSENIISKHYIVNEINGKQLRKLRSKIGVVSQSYNIIKQQTVLRNVLNSRVSKMNFWNSFFGIFSKKDKMIALKSLEKLNILDKAYVRAQHLSGGQQQRVALARALAQNPQLIIADEPVSALDPTLANQVMKDFKDINEKDKTIIIMNIHHTELALQYASRIIGIRDGEIIFDGKANQATEQVLNDIYGKIKETDNV